MRRLVLPLLLSVFSVGALAQEAGSVEGIWLTQAHDFRIEIRKTTEGTFEGAIVWLKKPNEADGSDKRDKNNPDEILKKRQLIGLKLLDGFKYDVDDKEWINGTIYDPQTGNTYKCYMWFEKDPDVLHVKGYIGISVLGRKVEWKRVEQSS